MAAFITLLLVSLSLIASSFGDNKVQVGFYAESLCPDCIALSTKYMNKAVEEVSLCCDDGAYNYIYTSIGR